MESRSSAGCHGFSEKPIATTVADARAMITACRDAGVQLHVAFVCRFLPHVRSVKKALDSGSLGEVIGLRAGNRGRPPLPPPYPAWITQVHESGGGALIDHSVYLTDLVRHLTGREVTLGGCRDGRPAVGRGRRGLCAAPRWCSTTEQSRAGPELVGPGEQPWDYDFFLRLVGTGGSVDLDDLAESVRVVSGRTAGGLRLAGFAEDSDAEMIETFCASVRQGRLIEPSASGEDGLRALEVALAGYASASSGAQFVKPTSQTV